MREETRGLSQNHRFWGAGHTVIPTRCDMANDARLIREALVSTARMLACCVHELAPGDRTRASARARSHTPRTTSCRGCQGHPRPLIYHLAEFERGMVRLSIAQPNDIKEMIVCPA